MMNRFRTYHSIISEKDTDKATKRHCSITYYHLAFDIQLVFTTNLYDAENRRF